MSPRSIRFRLTAWYAVILTVTFAVVGVGAWWAIRDSIHDTIDKDLRSRLQAVRDYLHQQAADPDSGPLAEELAEDAALTPAGTLIRLAGADGRWVYQSPGTKQWDAKPPLASRLPERGETETVVAAGRPFRVLTAPVSVGAVQIGTPIDEYYEMLGDFTWTAALASPLILLLASAAGYWMSRRALEPVDRIARTAEEIGAQNLSERLPLMGAGDELDRLSATLNAMFARLEAAFHRITRFTADASHELRTPVAVIRTTAELALSKPRGQEEYTRELARILAESERASRLIEDLMTLARADAGDDGVVPEPLDLAEPLREACAEARVLADAAGLRFHTEIRPGCPVAGDCQALRRLFLILLDNAVKYTPAGGEIRVVLSAGQGAAVVEVQDSGAGIAPEDLPHVFDRFYRAAKDRSRKTGGAGLGLAIAQSIAARHGGAVSAQSAPGAGSLFPPLVALASRRPALHMVSGCREAAWRSACFFIVSSEWRGTIRQGGLNEKLTLDNVGGHGAGGGSRLGAGHRKESRKRRGKENRAGRREESRGGHRDESEDAGLASGGPEGRQGANQGRYLERSL